ncbi:hypothetical protein MSIMFB_05268 [Mycobacterium simulans]|uniref:Uncharacterized protein n=1 Tax=Mycobacterium simulans TaxID=627089 RepID=A0A7Z7NCC4_9MYCO|nr:hypothetical protein MSIMFB_05268 [Mycobacterium simulans]
MKGRIVSLDGGRWGHLTMHLPKNLTRDETKRRIKAEVKRILSETGEWPVVIGCPQGAHEHSLTETYVWFVEYRTGPVGQETRWRDMPAHIHSK